MPKFMKACVEFRSELFKPFLPESAQVNPNCYGAELAWWVSLELARKGFVTSYPNNEDWGWFVEYFVEDYEYWLCCSNVPEKNNGWRIYLNCKPRGLFGRNKAPVGLAEGLLTVLSEILSSMEGIDTIQWSDAPN